MKNILESPIITEICDMTANMYRLGWDERNGGNISWLLDEQELADTWTFHRSSAIFR